MMNYEEMTRSVLEKVKMRKAVQKRKIRRVAFVACGLCCALLFIGVGQELSDFDDFSISGETNPGSVQSGESTEENKSDTPRITLLTASSNGDKQMPMPFNLEVPYQAEIRVHNISGLSETEIQQLASAERDYVRQNTGEYAMEYSYSPNRRENVFVSCISLGCFKLRFEDSSQVDRIRATVTENGRLHIFPRIKGCSNSAHGTISIIDVDGESLRGIADDADVDVDLIWFVSVETVDKIDAAPDMDLASICDTVTIMVSYSDGREEIAVVNINVDSDGDVSATLNEPVVVLNGGVPQ